MVSVASMARMDAALSAANSKRAGARGVGAPARPLAPGALPGGYAMGEGVFYCGETQAAGMGYRWEHGAAGQVTGAGFRGDLMVQFGGNKVPVACLLAQLSREWPPPPTSLLPPAPSIAEHAYLPGGLEVGHAVFYWGDGDVHTNGERWEYGAMGAVTAAGRDETEVMVRFAFNSGDVNCCVAQLCADWPPPPLPGGFERHDEVFFCGDGQLVSGGDTLEPGGRGEVVGAASGEGRVSVRFPGNRAGVGVSVALLCRSWPPPPLAGGFARGDEVFFCGGGFTTEGGGAVAYSTAGRVVGPGADAAGEVAVRFDGCRWDIACLVADIGRRPPPPVLLGGLMVTDPVFYCGETHRFPSGNTLVHGAKGEVVGPSTGAFPEEDLAVRFPGSAAGINCPVDKLSRSWPPHHLPGGLCVGDAVFSCVAAVAFPSGDVVEYGAPGVVRGADGDAPDTSVRVAFSGSCQGPIACSVQELCRAWPPPPLPDDHAVGDEVYYCGEDQTITNQRGTSVWVRGARGKVSGPGTAVDGDPMGHAHVNVRFPKNTLDLACYVTDLSPTWPPPLPGGFAYGEKVYFCGESHTFPSGDTKEYGASGVVDGRSTSDADAASKLKVRFDGNRDTIDVYVVNLSRVWPPPPLPGDMAVGDAVYFKGASAVASNGERWRYGARGEVVGPDENAPEHSVAVRFVGNGSAIGCAVEQVHSLA